MVTMATTLALYRYWFHSGQASESEEEGHHYDKVETSLFKKKPTRVRPQPKPTQTQTQTAVNRTGAQSTSDKDTEQLQAPCEEEREREEEETEDLYGGSTDEASDGMEEEGRLVIVVAVQLVRLWMLTT